MHGGQAERIEAIVDRLAAALFAGALGYAFFGGMGSAYREPQLLLFATIAAVMAFLLCARSLATVEPESGRFDVPVFGLAEIECSDADELLLTNADQIPVDELLLTDADRLRAVGSHAADELVLDDVLGELGADSRVVRLFDRAAMPTPAQLDARIEQHPGGLSPPPPPDASQALYDALAELRRSLR
jgi:hypothetical protein